MNFYEGIIGGITKGITGQVTEQPTGQVTQTTLRNPRKKYFRLPKNFS
jgi:hypothetical protein